MPRAPCARAAWEKGVVHGRRPLFRHGERARRRSSCSRAARAARTRAFAGTPTDLPGFLKGERMARGTMFRLGSPVQLVLPAACRTLPGARAPAPEQLVAGCRTGRGSRRARAARCLVGAGSSCWRVSRCWCVLCAPRSRRCAQPLACYQKCYKGYSAELITLLRSPSRPFRAAGARCTRY